MPSGFMPVVIDLRPSVMVTIPSGEPIIPQANRGRRSPDRPATAFVEIASVDMLLERLIHECVSSLPHRVWEIMLAIGMLDPQ